MYMNFFHFTKEPFRITPDPEFLFLSPSHKEALGSIIYGVEQRKGFIAITGEVGTGKTTIIRSYLERADCGRIKLVYIFNSNVSFGEFLKNVIRELDMEPPQETVSDMIRQLHKHLIEQYKQNNNVILIIDEAQNMPVETLEQLRMLSNLETTKEKLIQIILVGQPELVDKLNLNELRQLKQRLAIRATIKPLSRRECLDYIKHRLSLVTSQPDAVFTLNAIKKIAKHAKGIPRSLNNLCDNALIATYGYQKKKVSLKIVQEVIVDYEGKSKAFYISWKHVLAMGVICLIGGCFALT